MSVTVPFIVEVVVWAVVLEDRRWRMKRERKRTISDEQRFLSLVPLVPIT